MKLELEILVHDRLKLEISKARILNLMENEMNKNEHHEHISLHSRQKTMCIIIRQYSNQALHKNNMHNHFSHYFWHIQPPEQVCVKLAKKKKKKC